MIQVDAIALIRALLIGLSGGMITASVAAFIARKAAAPKNIWFLAGFGVALGVSVIVFFSWPDLITVPGLGNLSQAEAEILLQKKNLIPIAIPQHGTQTQAGRVIPFSQDPESGLSVRRMTAVRFGVAADGPLPFSGNGTAITLDFFQPKGGGTVKVSQGGDGIHRFVVSGTSTGLSNRHTLLLWAKPVKPASDRMGWYLQRLPGNGITSVFPDGRWEGTVQVGNEAWAPHDGDILDLAVTAMDSELATQLLNQAGVVTQTSLPGVMADVASGVRIELR